MKENQFLSPAAAPADVHATTPGGALAHKALDEMHFAQQGLELVLTCTQTTQKRVREMMGTLSQPREGEEQ